MSLVPGKVALANESDQNSATLKNVTVNTGTVKFNTAIEYDTDAAFTSYSRVKHYIIGGKAYSYSYDDAGNTITDPQICDRGMYNLFMGYYEVGPTGGV